MTYQSRLIHKPTDTPINPPNRGELDTLAVLWAEQGSDNLPLRLNEVYKRVCERRRDYGEIEPALTTISTHLRGLVKKKLIREVDTNSDINPRKKGNRGLFTPMTRSPYTGYQSLYGPFEVLQTTFRALGDAYPPDRRLEVIVDFARANGIPAEVIDGMEKLLQMTPGK